MHEVPWIRRKESQIERSGFFVEGLIDNDKPRWKRYDSTSNLRSHSSQNAPEGSLNCSHNTNVPVFVNTKKSEQGLGN